MNERDAGDRLVEVVTWALDRILNLEYQEGGRDAQGNLLSLELSTKPLDTESLELFLKKTLPPEQWEAILSLKERRSREDIDRVMRLVFPSEIAATAVEELDGADWPEIVAYIDEQVKFLRFHIGQKIAEVLVKEREGFSTPFGRDAERFLEERVPEGLAAMPATKYAREFREVFPEMVRRAQELHLLPVREKVPEYVRRILVEASRSYIHGQFVASLILCRSAIEEAVEERLRAYGHGKRISQIKKEEWFCALLKLAHDEQIRILDDSTYRLADDIRKLANAAIHGERLPTDEICVNAYKQTRYILQYLYE